LGGNTLGDYEASLNAATQAIRLFTRLGDSVPWDERASRLARAEMAAGFAAKGLRRHEESLAHYQEMGKWAQLAAKSQDHDILDYGRTLQKWSIGCIGETIEALGQPERALREYYLPLWNELRSRKVSEQTGGDIDLHDWAASCCAMGRVYNSLGQYEA